jgi:hypothetical protein
MSGEIPFYAAGNLTRDGLSTIAQEISSAVRDTPVAHQRPGAAGTALRRVPWT